jgi:hypothetical protein
VLGAGEPFNIFPDRVEGFSRFRSFCVLVIE